MRYAAIPMLAMLCACGATTPPPATQIKVVKQTVEVQRPCPVTVPPRPAPLEQPLPSDLFKLAAVLGAKLAEWSGPGMYGDKVDTALRKCVEP